MDAVAATAGLPSSTATALRAALAELAAAGGYEVAIPGTTPGFDWVDATKIDGAIWVVKQGGMVFLHGFLALHQALPAGGNRTSFEMPADWADLQGVSHPVVQEGTGRTDGIIVYGGSGANNALAVVNHTAAPLPIGTLDIAISWPVTAITSP